MSANEKIDLIYDIVKEINEKQNEQTERLVRLECNVEKTLMTSNII